MFQYEYERPRRSVSVVSCDSRATADWSRAWPSSSGNSRADESCRSSARALPSQPAVLCGRIHSKTNVPLKVWLIAGAACFAACALLVVATVAITKWGSSDTYSQTGRFYSEQKSLYAKQKTLPKVKTTEPPLTDLDDPLPSEEDMNDIKYPILEKLSIFKNIVGNRESKKDRDEEIKDKQKTDLLSKPQFYPEHDSTLKHVERKIEKKDQPKALTEKAPTRATTEPRIPEFKPTLPDIFVNKATGIQLSDGYKTGLKYESDFEDYVYSDEHLYEDYIQSNSMTSYLIEKVQELHDWVINDSDFYGASGHRGNGSNEFGQLLTALNASIVEGDIGIIMTKLKDIYYGDNYTLTGGRNIILTNRTDLLSFGILTLDVILLHNIQLMAWETQDVLRNRMLRDPDVFAFSALFMDPSKVELKREELLHHHDSGGYGRRHSHRQDQLEDNEIGKNLMENILELGMNTARAAIHLGRAYKNTQVVLSQQKNKDKNGTVQLSSRNVNAHGSSLQGEGTSVADGTTAFYTELDCVWLLYCRNLVTTAKLAPPYGVMARINGVALRMLSGELSPDKAIDTLLYEALGGWTELKCNDMFPRCSKVNASNVVLESILQPMRKPAKSSR